MYRTGVSRKHSDKLRQRWWSNLLIIWRIIPVVDWFTVTANHSTMGPRYYGQHAVCHCQESGKTATQLLQMLLVIGGNAGHYRPVRRGRTRMSYFVTFNWCICSLSDVSLRRWLQWPRLRNSRPLLLKSDVNLFNHLVRKRMLRVVVLRVLFFVDMRLPQAQCRWFVLSEVVFTLSWWIN